MDTSSKVNVRIDTTAKLDAITEYAKRTAAAAERTAELREQMSTLTGMGKLGVIFSATGLSISALGQTMQTAITRSAQLGSEIVGVSNRVGVSAEAYQVLGATLKAAGGTAEDLATGLGVLRRVLGEALGDPKGSVAQSLGELGLRAADLSRLKPEVQFERIAQALARVEDPARRAALAQDMLGRGGVALTPLLESLARDGYGALRAEVERTAGIMSDEMASALNEAGDRAEAAGNRMAVAMSPFQLKIAETKASIAELFADLSASPLQSMAFAATAAVGAGVAVAGAGAAAGGLGSGAAWGMLAGVTLAKAAAASAPVWVSIGVLIAGAFAGAAVIKGMEQAALSKGDLRDDFTKAPLDRANTLRDQLKGARDPAMIDRIQAEAARRARAMFQQAQGTEDVAMRANLEQASRIYSGLVTHAREHKAEIVAANKALDELNAKKAEEARRVASAQKRDEQAAEWLKKNADSIEQRVAEMNRKLALGTLAPAERLVKLEEERTAVLEANERFTGGAAEIRKNDIETALRVVELDQEIVATRKEITAETERATAAAERQREAAKRFMEDHRKAKAMDKDRDVDRRLGALHADDAANQASFRLTEEQKRALRRESLTSQQTLATEGADFHRSRGDLPAAQRYEDRATAIGGTLAADAASKPETVLEGVEGGLTRIQDRWGSLAEQMQTNIASIGDAITGSLTRGMEGLLGTTNYWSQKLGSIAGPIMGSVTGAISRMFAEWITARAAASMKSILFSKTEGAAELAAKAPGAMMASISSFGTAALVGVAAFLAAKALGGGFYEGGFTGLGNPRDPAGIVHKGEFVVPHDVTAAVGPGALSGLVESVRNPSVSLSEEGGLPVAIGGRFGEYPAVESKESQPPPPAPPRKDPRMVVIFEAQKEMLATMLADPGFQTQVVRIARLNRAEIGIQV